MSKVRTGQVHPGISDRDHKMVAELLACWTNEDNPNYERLRDHRRAKLATFPQGAQERIRNLANAVITARSKK